MEWGKSDLLSRSQLEDEYFLIVVFFLFKCDFISNSKRELFQAERDDFGKIKVWRKIAELDYNLQESRHFSCELSR